MLFPDEVSGIQLSKFLTVLAAGPETFTFSGHVSTAHLTGTEDGWRRCAVVIPQGYGGFLQTCEDGLSDERTHLAAQFAGSVDVHLKVSEGVDESDGARETGNREPDAVAIQAGWGVGIG